MATSISCRAQDLFLRPSGYELEQKVVERGFYTCNSTCVLI